VLTGAGLTPGRYRIVDVRVEAEPTQHGKPWDRSEAESGVAPDLQVEISLDGKPIASCNGPQDSIFARCKLDLEIEVDRATQVSMVVNDRDSVFDDFVGSATLRDPSHWDVDLDLPMATSSDLRTAVLVLARVPPLWQIVKHRVLAGLVGTLAAIAFVIARRRRARPTIGTPALEPLHRRVLLDDPAILLATGAALFAAAFDAASLVEAIDRTWGFAIACGLAMTCLTLDIAHVVEGRRLRPRHLALFVMVVGVIVTPLGTLLFQAIASGLFVLALIAVALK